jgi:hypothetical protein
MKPFDAEAHAHYLTTGDSLERRGPTRFRARAQT